MPKDPRRYITLDSGMPEHPKAEALSDAAFRLLIELWCWCSRQMNDGLMSLTSWERRGAVVTRDELVAVGLVDVDGDQVSMHDYLEHQESRADILERRERLSASGRKGGLAKAANVASATADAKASAKQGLKPTPSKGSSIRSSESLADEMRRDEITTSAEKTPLTAISRFEEFWSAYPRKVGRGAAERAFKAAAKKASEQTLIEAASRFAVASRGKDVQYIPHGSTWLNGERWADEAAPAPTEQRDMHGKLMIGGGW